MDTELIQGHSLGEADVSPLQLISAELLEHYRRCEAELAVLQAAGTGAESGAEIREHRGANEASS